MANKSKLKYTKRKNLKSLKLRAKMMREKKNHEMSLIKNNEIFTENEYNEVSDIFVAEQQRVESPPLRYLNLDVATSTSESIINNNEIITENKCNEVSDIFVVEQQRVESPPLRYLNLDVATSTSESLINNNEIITENKCNEVSDIFVVEQQRVESPPLRYFNLDVATSTSDTSNLRKRKLNDDDEQLRYETDLGNRDVENGIGISGHRIVDIKEFMLEMQTISTHESLYDCGLNSLEIVSEKRVGLNSEFKLSCQMCKKAFNLKSSSADLNKNAVSGAMVAGCGQAELNQFTAALNLPSMSTYTFNRVQDEVCNEWELTAWDEMKKAGMKEREAAIKEGRVDKNGIPLIDVILDGCWSKRSYRTNYSASSGAAAIIGRRFGQVLFMSVKNKYCCICAQAERKQAKVMEHACYKNYSGPSTAMEATIIVEGFKQSMEMHQVIYNRFIADGDSNTYAKILEARPYPNITVEKINCRNHILRNFCNKLQLLKSDTKYRVDERKVITTEKILSARRYVKTSIQKHKTSTATHSEKIKNLYKDISVCLKHGFGSHENCNKEICTKETTLKANDSFFNSNLWQKMKFITTNVASHARSLIEDVDSNIVECFNSVVAKFVGGKRVNYALRRSYQARCAGAVISFNTGRVLSTVHQNIYNEPVGEQQVNHETKSLKKREDRKKTKKISKRCAQTIIEKDINYGKNADTPDLDPMTFEMKKDSFLKDLERTEEERKDIEARTNLQSHSGEWMELRRNLLTASNFGKVVKRNFKNSCQNIVKNMLYKTNIQHVSSVAHGVNNEKSALEQLSVLLNKKIDDCGLYIDEHHQFLGASPDGIIKEEDMLVEIKCPVAASKIGIDAAIAAGKMHFWRVNKDTGEIFTNKKSDWYFQIQGQMHIAKKKKCLLAAWYGDWKLKTEIFERDDQFWSTIMEPKLIKFYFDCLLPELVNPRFTRNRPIRDPPYVIVKAKTQNIKEKENSKPS